MLIYSLINKYVLWSLISPLQPAPADSSREKERFLAPRLPSRGSHGAGGLCVRPAGPPAERVVSPVVQKWHLLRLARSGRLPLAWPSQLLRQFTQGGRPFDCWGMSSIEAATII